MKRTPVTLKNKADQVQLVEEMEEPEADMHSAGVTQVKGMRFKISKICK